MGEETKVPPLPLQIIGPRPHYLKDVRLGLEEEKKSTQAQANQPFLYKYVSSIYFFVHYTGLVLTSCACMYSGTWCWVWFSTWCWEEVEILPKEGLPKLELQELLKLLTQRLIRVCINKMSKRHAHPVY